MGLIKKEGYLTKSPPGCKMDRRGSWCKRYFVLLESGSNDKIQGIGGINNNNNNNNNKNSSNIEIYLMYWDNENKKGEKPKGFYLFIHFHH